MAAQILTKEEFFSTAPKVISDVEFFGEVQATVDNVPAIPEGPEEIAAAENPSEAPAATETVAPVEPAVQQIPAPETLLTESDRRSPIPDTLIAAGKTRIRNAVRGKATNAPGQLAVR